MPGFDRMFKEHDSDHEASASTTRPMGFHIHSEIQICDLVLIGRGGVSIGKKPDRQFA